MASTSLVSLVNIVFSFITISFGFYYYKKTKSSLLLSITLAFFCFMVSHIVSLLTHTIFPYFIFLLRTIGYLIIIIALYQELRKTILMQYKKSIKYKIINASIITIILATILYESFLTYKYFFLHIFNKNQFYIINAIICFIIVILSYLNFYLKKQPVYFYLGLALFIFGFSHLLTIILVTKGGALFISFIRVLAYLISVTTIYSFSETHVKEALIELLEKTRFQVLISIIFIIIFTLSLYLPTLQFRATDPKPLIYPIKPTLSEEQIIEVETGLFVKDFQTFDVKENNFVMNAIVWFKFDPNAISLDIVEKFSFDKGTILEKSKPETKILEKDLFVSYRIQLQFKAPIDYSFFPLEDHVIYLLLTNTTMDPKETVLKSYNTNFALNEKIFTGDWLNVNENVEYGYYKSELDSRDQTKTSLYPVILFALGFEQTGIKKLFIIFTALFIAFFLSLLSLIINAEKKSAIISLSIGGISTIIFNLFIITELTPSVRYFTVADTIILLFCLCTFAILLFNIYIIKKVEKVGVTNTITFSRNLVFILFISIVILSLFYLIQ